MGWGTESASESSAPLRIEGPNLDRIGGFEGFSERFFNEDGFFDPPSRYAAYLAEQGLNQNTAFQAWLDEAEDYGMPEIMSGDKFQKYVSDNDLIVLNRGVLGIEELSSEDMVNRFAHGEKYYAGTGIYGDGTYFSNLRSTAIDFATDPHGSMMGTVMTAALKKSAKVGSYFDVSDELNESTGLFLSGAVSSYARSKGYDALVARQSNGEYYYNVLNRSALVISSDYEHVRGNAR